MPLRLEKCVKHVMAQGKPKSSAFPICVSSTGLKPHKGKKKKMKESIQEGETTGGSGVGTGKRIVKQIGKYKNLTPEKSGKKKSQVFNIMRMMRKRSGAGSEFNAGSYLGTVLPHMHKLDVTSQPIKARKKPIKKITKEQVETQIKLFLESRNVEPTPELVNEFLHKLAGLIGKGMGHVGSKLSGYAQHRGAEVAKYKSIGKTNKITHGINKQLKGLVKKGPSALRSKEGRKLQLLQRETSRHRLAAKGIKLKNNKGRFPKSKDFAHVRRQVERFIEQEKELVQEGSLGHKRSMRLNKMDAKQIRKTKANPTISNAQEMEKKHSLYMQHADKRLKKLDIRKKAKREEYKNLLKSRTKYPGSSNESVSEGSLSLKRARRLAHSANKELNKSPINGKKYKEKVERHIELRNKIKLKRRERFKGIYDG